MEEAEYKCDTCKDYFPELIGRPGINENLCYSCFELTED